MGPEDGNTLERLGGLAQGRCCGAGLAATHPSPHTPWGVPSASRKAPVSIHDVREAMHRVRQHRRAAGAGGRAPRPRITQIKGAVWYTGMRSFGDAAPNNSSTFVIRIRLLCHSLFPFLQMHARIRPHTRTHARINSPTKQPTRPPARRLTHRHSLIAPFSPSALVVSAPRVGEKPDAHLGAPDPHTGTGRRPGQWGPSNTTAERYEDLTWQQKKR